jgi:molybdate transport system substrate-binding protein
LLRRLVRFAGAALLVGAAAPSQAAELTVSAAASLTQAFKEIGSAFEAQDRGTTVLFNFAASGALLQQIAKGAPVDVLACADQETMDQAEQRQLVRAGTRQNFVRNTLVAIVPAKAVAVPGSLQDLLQPKLARIALGTPASVPAGRYARAALEKAGIWSAVETKLIGASSVRQVLDYVARGEVDLGFVYATDAALMADKVRLAFTVPTGTPVLYPLAAVAGSANAAPAGRFVAFVLSAPAQAILARHGFAKP